MHLVFKLFSFTNCHGNVLTVIECDKEKTVIALVYSIEVDNLAVVDSKEKWVVEHVLSNTFRKLLCRDELRGSLL